MGQPINQTRADWLREATTQLANAGIESSRLDALVLLEDATSLERSSLLAHLEEKLDDQQLDDLTRNISLRLTHLPLAYIRNSAPFYGRDFIVSPDVLVPRPESETIISLLKDLPHVVPLRLADIGTGSGVLGVTAALEISQISQVHLYDISPAALTVAHQNADKFAVHADYFEQDLLTEITESAEPYDVILANLPYVPINLPLNRAAAQEPPEALFAGPDGLDLYRKLFNQLQHLGWNTTLLTEALPSQHEALKTIAGASGFRLATKQDFIQVWQSTGSVPIPVSP